MKPDRADPLFTLVKSLDRNEKGYFKKFAARYGEKHSGNIYLRIFDTLDKMDIYDEQKFISKFTEKGGARINLSAQKKYLHQQILKSLRAYYSGKNLRYTLTEKLLDAQNLLDKNLTQEALETLQYITETSINESFSDIAISALLQMEALMQRQWGVFTTEQISNVKKRIGEALVKLQQEHHLSNLLYEMKLLDDERGRQDVVDTSLMQKVDALMADELLQNPEALTPRGKMLAYGIFQIDAAIRGDDRRALHYMILRHHLMENLGTDRLSLTAYLANVSNIIMACLNIGDVNEASKFLQILEKNTYREKNAEAYRRHVLAKNTLMYLMVKSISGITAQEVRNAEAMYLNTNPQPAGNNNLMSAYYLAILYYCVGERDKSIFWLEQVTQYKNVSYINVQAYCKILMAYLYMESKQVSLAVSNIHAATYFMRKHKISSPFLRGCLQIANKLVSALGKNQFRILLEGCEQKFAELFTRELRGEVTYFHDFNLMLWSRAMRQGTSYAKELQKQGSLAAV
ncbi:MAG: hypothetical protein RML37_05935 [Chitinophagales bacterium]|nr:hypothetical protein [Chitinophagales bacterium]